MLIVANWKMNSLRREGIDRARKLRLLSSEKEFSCNIIVCPPAHIIHEVRQALDGSDIGVGAQDCHFDDGGAHTGDISVKMLADLGCTHIIVGHSERRQEHFENDEIVKMKAKKVHSEGLISIICIGETKEEKESGKALDRLHDQLSNSLPETINSINTVVAYEPCWAIGSGLTPNHKEIEDAHTVIRDFLKRTIPKTKPLPYVLYGGSVNGNNAEGLLQIQGVSGALVGGASLDPTDFWKICQYAETAVNLKNS